MDPFKYKFIITYLVAVIPGLSLFSLGKKRQSILFIALTVVSFLGFLLIRSDKFGMFFFLSAILLWVSQIIYLISLVIRTKYQTRLTDPLHHDTMNEPLDSSRPNAKDSVDTGLMGLTFKDVIKGLIFVFFMIIAYYSYGIILALFSHLLSKAAQYPLLLPVVLVLIIGLFIYSIIVGAFSKIVEAGFPLHSLFKSKKSEKSKTNEDNVDK